MYFCIPRLLTWKATWIAWDTAFRTTTYRQNPRTQKILRKLFLLELRTIRNINYLNYQWTFFCFHMMIFPFHQWTSTIQYQFKMASYYIIVNQTAEKLSLFQIHQNRPSGFHSKNTSACLVPSIYNEKIQTYCY